MLAGITPKGYLFNFGLEIYIRLSGKPGYLLKAVLLLLKEKLLTYHYVKTCFCLIPYFYEAHTIRNFKKIP